MVTSSRIVSSGYLPSKTAMDHYSDACEHPTLQSKAADASTPADTHGCACMQMRHVTCHACSHACMQPPQLVIMVEYHASADH
eukprot:351281-Chlamydomonas_euryale.AAC.9